MVAQTTDQPSLKITEIFFSIQGESSLVGFPSVFIRLTGCPLRCSYCDTAYAFHGGQRLTIDQILERVASFKAKHVCVTGGEPLAQKNCLPLLRNLCDKNYVVSLETSGALTVADVDPRVVKVIDIKTPGSGEESKNLWDNLNYVTANDQLKFVVTDKSDYDYAVTQIRTRELADKCSVLLSPGHNQVSPKDLAEWILADQLPVRLQVQLHKILWGDTPGK